MGKKSSTSRDKLFSFFIVAKELRSIVKSQSEELYSDPQRLLKILKDNLHLEHLREIFLIIAPLKANIIDLLTSTKDNKKLERKFLHTINKISSQSGYDEADAKWAVYTWAYALGRIAEKDYYEIFQLDPFPKDISTPIEEVPTAPIEEVPTAPIEEVPTAPIEEVPTAPIEEVPTAPIEEVPTAPIEEVPTAPIEEVPTAPIEEVPTAPIEEVPTAPKEEVPTAPIEEVPTAPKEEVPTAPKEEVPTAPKDNGSHAPIGVRFDNEIKPARKSGKLPVFSSIFKNNKVRIPIAGVVAVIVIGFIILFTSPPDTQPNDTQPPVYIVGPSALSAGDSATVAENASPNADGSIPEYKWSYNLINGSESESKTLQNGPKAEFQTPFSVKKYSLQVELLAKDDKGSYNKVAEKTITVNPVQIKIVPE